MSERNNTHALHRRAEQASANKQRERALQIYDQLLAVAPDDVAAWNNRGDVLRFLKRPAEAEASFDEAIKRCGGRHQHLSLFLSNRGKSIIHQGEPARSIPDFERALAVDPANAVAHYDLACAFALTGQREQALSHLDRALQLREAFRGEARHDSDFQSLRGDPGFALIVRR